MRTRLTIHLVCSILLVVPLLAQERVNHDVVSRIKEEGFQNSRVMETLSYLCDVHGPRLLGTPGYLNAAEWAKNEMRSWGLANVRLDPFDNELRGWTAESFSVEMIQPTYTRLPAYPRAWTSGTGSEVSGVPLVLDAIDKLDSLKKHQGQLEGKIIFVGRGRKIGPNFEPFSTRFTNQQLTESGRNIVPIPKKTIGFISGQPVTKTIDEFSKLIGKDAEIQQFLLDEGVASLVFPSIYDHGILHVDGTYFTKIGEIKPVPHFIISNEQFSRIIRMMDKGVEPVLKLHLRAQFHEDPRYKVNVVGEITGSDKKLREQLVLIGGHFDSWHSGTGATDNGAGSAVMMEALRILKAIGARPRRTIRVVLWAGEEQGFWGSRGYVSKYVGNIFTGEKKAEQSRISAYFNFDNGSGKIRGIYLQGNEAVRPIFSALLQPFAYLDANTLTIQNANWTDHEIFDALNVPAFQFIQDPLNYMSITHHTNMDVLEYVIEDDLKQSAVVVASLAYHVAMRDEMLPRKRQMAAPKKEKEETTGDWE